MMHDSVTAFAVKDVKASARYYKDELGFGAVSIFVDDVDRLHADLQKRGARILKAPANYGYGLRDFDVADLDGNMLFFGMETPKT
jgi:catechol 2,3-dioxygenase-like lactoylglutathione lyase family enzyme